MIITEKEKELCKYLMAYALKKKCNGVRIHLLKNENSGFEYRNGQLDKLESNSENALFISLFKNGRFGSFSSNRLQKSDLELFVDNAVNAINILTPDLAHSLPDACRYYQGSGNLDLFDENYENHDTQEKIEMLKISAEEINGADNIVSVSTSYEDNLGRIYTIASNGFEKENSKTSYHLSSSIVLATESDVKLQDYSYKSASHWDKLEKDGLTKRAFEKAKAKLNPKKLSSGEYDLITDRKSGLKFLSPIIGAIQGASLSQKRSFLLDKRGEKIFGDKISLYDRPHQIGKMGSRFYDGEGVATRDIDIIRNGVLCNYYLDTYYANKLGDEPTISSPTGIYMDLGTKNLTEMIAEVQKGIWVTSYNGGNVNTATGDFSFGVEGFYIEEGQIIHPISEMNITGNILMLWNRLKEIGNDPRLNKSNQIPSLWFENISFNGI